ncbi:dihydroorotate dehydrogenase, mitochondrial precursor, putative [Theileria annulata]|uniref:Dihydroorotate dehydrogenase (quinone), mitochondrial n=1 Tax=Theileria annulata TaxID=5874 RepID=Q4UDM3_THEAN|nr:dihydroorotate dehydrogenase, mitochondrial precursor, putative [Theileria annulata]CAI74816.1 dihydroorotate dehydrogenase, mitochondrial precursor, putative [Theileria annulata]|eukprot:XP_952548.1 dihydroorotate dehydrogenase, mitochondrial precursor, putative [Theileria annulata]
MGVGAYACMRNPNCPIYDGILYGLRKWVDPEDSHKLSIFLAKLGLTPVDYSIDPPILYNNIKHIKIFNPIGMAAGYDKNCEVALEILRLGFGFIELGTVLPKPQPGNPKPRLFRLPNNKALINCLGFNSLGIDTAVENMKATRARQKNDPLTKDSIIGISIGKNLKGEILSDVSYCIQKIGLYSDYLCINVSSPNTPNLRDNQKREPLIKLIKTSKKSLEDLDKRVSAENLSYINTTKTKPLLFFKISALEHNLDGLILTNTTVMRPENLKEELEKAGNPRGGLSGNPLKEHSKRIVFEMYKLTNGKIPIIACGGISTAQDALEMIEAGASVCQLFTGLVYHGPKLPSLIKKDLANLLNKKGYKNIKEAIGSAHNKK